MGCVIDKLEKCMEVLNKSPDKITDESFMMGMFGDFADELPEFREYLDLLFKKKRMALITRKSKTKVMHYSCLRQRLFSPTHKSERDATIRMV